MIVAGENVTVVGYGSQIQVLRAACAQAQKELGITCELIDLRTILPWDQETIIEANHYQTSHPLTAIAAVCQEDGTPGCEPRGAADGRLCGRDCQHHPGACCPVRATCVMLWQEKCFLHLEAPVQRVCGWDTPFPLAFEDFYLPDQHRCFEAIKAAATF